MNPNDYLTDPYDEDLAYDFVETELGRIHFRENWERLENKEQRIKEWLTSIGEDPERASALQSHLEQVYSEKRDWGGLKTVEKAATALKQDAN